MRPQLRAYLLAMAAPAVAVTLLLLWLPPAPPGDPWLAALLVALGALAANFPVMVSPRYKADAAPAIYIALVLIFPAALAVALVGLIRLVGEGVLCVRRNPATGRRRRQPIDLVFNTSQLMLASAAAALAFRALAPHSELGAGLLSALPGAIVASCLLYVISIALVVVAVGLHTRRNPFEIWVEAAAADFKQTAALYVAGFLLAVLSNGQTWLALAMMVPVAGIQLALSRSVQLMEQTIAAVESMADVVDRRDPYTFQHSQSVANHSVSIARKLRLPDREVELIRLAARVHDLGKIAVPDEVLHKQGRLTSTEFELMKKHPETGVEILSKFPEYKRGRELVLAHHERMDGLGYPRGIAGPAIALGARIIAVADSWDAMTSNRPYRTALDHDVALAELYRGRGTQWDPAVVDAFANTLPGASPEVRQGRFAEVGRPLLRSLGAAVGAFAGN
ncbi:MAG: HD-GYP domain-containing protein [Chloroflexi bacterium]|nr:MAG: HD-GYP domain-containing protein [Chloroflexota bacterium]TMC72958.1 MAG: HD-GYP domain-containing protein [Chloroflexota bacterium]